MLSYLMLPPVGRSPVLKAKLHCHFLMRPLLFFPNQFSSLLLTTNKHISIFSLSLTVYHLLCLINELDNVNEAVCTQSTSHNGWAPCVKCRCLVSTRTTFTSQESIYSLCSSIYQIWLFTKRLPIQRIIILLPLMNIHCFSVFREHFVFY